MRFLPYRILVSLAVFSALMFSGCLNDSTDPADRTETGEDKANGAAGNETSEVFFETTASWTAGVAGCHASIGAHAFLIPLEGVTHEVIELPNGAIGKPFEATLESGDPAVEWGLEFWGSSLVEVHTATETTISGSVPPSTQRSILWSCADAGAQARLVIGNPEQDPGRGSDE